MAHPSPPLGPVHANRGLPVSRLGSSWRTPRVGCSMMNTSVAIPKVYHTEGFDGIG